MFFDSLSFKKKKIAYFHFYVDDAKEIKNNIKKNI